MKLLNFVVLIVLLLVSNVAFAACHTSWASLDGNWVWLTHCSPEYRYDGTMWKNGHGNKYYVPAPSDAHKEGTKDDGRNHANHAHYWTYKRVEKEAK
jgi:hypothetical protein